MTLSILLLRVAIAAILLTGITGLVLKQKKNWLTSYLQNFCGALFIFSGWVKAADPLGTSYKLVDYFDQFESVFAETWIGFIAPIFPLLSTYSVAFSVFVIIFEIVLGVMLIIGHKPKFTAWSFFLMLVFFTFLTGFTYLTGYVPGDVNFFDFGGWGAYDASNMKVTDCGCFGDFLKLEPKVSFLKDVFLLIPGIYFLAMTKSWHQLFTHNIRSIVVAILTVGLLVYCISNFVWDLPHADFRPFKKDANIAELKKLEEQAMANVQITAYKVENKTTGETKTIPYADYMKTFSEYPSAEWDLEQIANEPEIPITKISDFDASTFDYEHLNERILESEEPVLLLVMYELYGDGAPASRIVNDTIYQVDTLLRDDGSPYTVRNIREVNSKTVPYVDYQWKDYYAERFEKIVNPFVAEAKKAGIDVIALVAGADKDQVADFKNDIGLDVTYGFADDKLLKTIIRSNPGIVLMKQGKILDKWHYKKLPEFKVVEASYLK